MTATIGWQSIPFGVEALRKMQPRRVLDIGSNGPRWAVLARDFGPREVRIEAVDPRGSVANFYHAVHRRPALEMLQRLPGPWDAAIIGDVLCRLAKPQGVRLIDETHLRADYVLVEAVLPRLDRPTENGTAAWEPDDFAAWPVIREAVYRSDDGRPVAVYIISRNDPCGLGEGVSSAGDLVDYAPVARPDDELEAVLDRLAEQRFELDFIKQHSTYRWSSKLRSTPLWNALRWLHNRNVQVATVTALGEKGDSSKDAEVWLLEARPDPGVRSVPWDFVEFDGSWQAKEDKHRPYGRVYVTRRGVARIPLGDDPELVFLAHPWSGKVRVTWRGRSEVIDLSPRAERSVLVCPARTPMLQPGRASPAKPAAPASPRRSPAAAREAWQDEFIERVQRGDRKIVAVHCPRWLGITNSTRALFDQLYPVPHGPGVEPYTFDDKELERDADVLLEAGVEHVVFSGGDIIHYRLMEILHRRKPGIRFDVLWHGSYIQFWEDYNWKMVQIWADASKAGLLHTFGVVKKGMEEFLEAAGVRSALVLNWVPGEILPPAELDDDERQLGMWISNTTYRKIPHAMLAAVRMTGRARLHGAGIDRRTREVIDYFDIPVGELRMKALPADDLLAVIRRTHLSLYVTFSECCPMLPLESLRVGTPCLVGPNSHLFEDDEYLFSRLVVPFPDRAEVIASFIGRAFDERLEIARRYAEYIPGYNERARRSVEEFLAG